MCGDWRVVVVVVHHLTKYSGVKLSTDWFSARGVELSSDTAVPGVRIGQ